MVFVLIAIAFVAIPSGRNIFRALSSTSTSLQSFTKAKTQSRSLNHYSYPSIKFLKVTILYSPSIMSWLEAFGETFNRGRDEALQTQVRRFWFSVSVNILKPPIKKKIMLFAIAVNPSTLSPKPSQTTL